MFSGKMELSKWESVGDKHQFSVVFMWDWWAASSQQVSSRGLPCLCVSTVEQKWRVCVRGSCLGRSHGLFEQSCCLAADSSCLMQEEVTSTRIEIYLQRTEVTALYWSAEAVPSKGSAGSKPAKCLPKAAGSPCCWGQRFTSVLSFFPDFHARLNKKVMMKQSVGPLKHWENTQQSH